MFATKVLGNSHDTALNINHSSYKASLQDAVSRKATLPHPHKPR